MYNYNKNSLDSNEFINHTHISETLDKAKILSDNKEYVSSILNKAREAKGLSHLEAAVLLNVTDEKMLNEMFTLAKQLKEKIYGKRIVLFAPLYISNFCVNACKYCGYQCSNKHLVRKKLTKEQLIKEIEALEALGHKRLVIEAGEDDNNCSLEYILDTINTIYSLKFKNGAIRRININIAATTIENYKKLKEADIGTYVLFQETYHKETYKKLHPSGPKSNYEWHTEAMDRAMKGGIDDVGLGVLYGLYDFKYDTVAMILHAEHLESALGVGPHTVSVPRLRKADSIKLEDYPHLVSDDDFKKVVAVLRLTLPYTGMIISTREEQKYREEILALGISQTSAGSSVDIGGYSSPHKLGGDEVSAQFEVSDKRSPAEIIESLLKGGYIPSYCTACYREGRTGDRFMRLAKSGQIQNVCQPNALMTLYEYLLDYGNDSLRQLGLNVINEEIKTIPNEKIKQLTIHNINEIKSGKRDFRV